MIDKNKLKLVLKRGFIGLSDRPSYVFGSILLVVCVVISAIGMLIHESVEELLIDEMSKSAMNTAMTAAAFIEGDISSYEAFTEALDGEFPRYDEGYYDRMQNIFRKIKRETGVGFIYTMKRASDHQVMYLLDGEDPESDGFSPLGSIDRMSSYEERVLQGEGPVRTGMLEWGNWGDYLSGFAPIIGSSGQIIGIVGVDMGLQEVHALMGKVNYAIFLVVIMMTLVVTFYAFRMLQDRAVAYNQDYLTKLSSRRHHDIQLESRVDRIRRKGGELSIMMIDLDNFKNINDQFGHEAGDRMLRHVAEIIKGNLRRSDISSRIGGDEFNIILPDTDLEEARQVAWRIVREISQSTLGLNVSVSIGVAAWEKDMSAYDVSRLADQAMYKSKEAGKNQVQTVQCS